MTSTEEGRTFIDQIGNRCWSATFEVRHDWILLDLISLTRIVGLLLAVQELAKWPVPTSDSAKFSFLPVRSVRVVSQLWISHTRELHIARISSCIRSRIILVLLWTHIGIKTVLLLNVFSFDIKFTELSEIIHAMMRNADSFFRLFKCIFVSMNLRKDCAVL
jgi:hypothetical protein